MITDFIEIKEIFNKAMNLILKEDVRKNTPLIQNINKKMQHEGGRMSYQTVDKEEVEMKYRTAKGEFSVSREEMASLTLADIRKKIGEVADDFAGQMEGGMFEEISKSIEASGNVVENNPEFSSEAFLKALEKIYVDFDEDDRLKPKLPQVYMSPESFQKLKEQEKNATKEDIADFEARKNKILDVKYAEFIEREGKRKMVD